MNRIILLPDISGFNGTLMIRGAKADYDEWEELGNKGWSWRDVLPLFKKVRGVLFYSVSPV